MLLVVGREQVLVEMCESTSATEGVSGFYLDSPNTTSATTYDCRLSHGMNGEMELCI